MSLRRSTPMQRRPFRGKFEPPERAPRMLTPIRQLIISSAATAIFRPTPKTEYVRDRGYRQFVASLPCFCCGIEKRSQAAHSNSGSEGKGLGVKASDTALFPLCAESLGELGCHYKHDKLVDMTFEERLEREVAYFERMAPLELEFFRSR